MAVALTNIGSGSAIGAVAITATASVPAGATIVVCHGECISADPGAGGAHVRDDALGSSINYSVAGTVAWNNSFANGWTRVSYHYNHPGLPSGQSIYIQQNQLGAANSSTAFYVTGVSTANDPFDAGSDATKFGTGASMSVTTATAALAGSLILGVVGTPGTSGTFTQASGYSSTPSGVSSGTTASDTAIFVGTKVIGAGGAQTFAPSWTTSTVYGGIVLVLTDPTVANTGNANTTLGLLTGAASNVVGAAIAVTNIGSVGNSTGSTVAISSATVPNGATIIVATGVASTTTGGSVADDASNTYGLIGSQQQFNNGFCNCALWYAKNVNALGAGNITFTKPSGVTGLAALTAFYATGLASPEPLDATTVANASGTSTGASITSGTPSAFGDLFVAIVGRVGPGSTTQDTADGWGSPPSPAVSSNVSVYCGSLIASDAAAKTYAPTWTNSIKWGGVIAGFKASLGATPAALQGNLAGLFAGRTTSRATSSISASAQSVSRGAGASVFGTFLRAATVGSTRGKAASAYGAPLRAIIRSRSSGRASSGGVTALSAAAKAVSRGWASFSGGAVQQLAARSMALVKGGATGTYTVPMAASTRAASKGSTVGTAKTALSAVARAAARGLGTLTLGGAGIQQLVARCASMVRAGAVGSYSSSIRATTRANSEGKAAVSAIAGLKAISTAAARGFAKVGSGSIAGRLAAAAKAIARAVAQTATSGRSKAITLGAGTISVSQAPSQSAPIFPVLAGLEYPVQRHILSNTLVEQAFSGCSTGSPTWTYPRYRFVLSFSVLPSKTDWVALEGFARQVKMTVGCLFQFNFADDGTAIDQQFGIGDGTTLAFQLVRTAGGFTEPVYAVTAVTGVKVNGVAQPLSNFVVNSRGVLTFGVGHAPAAGAAITWSGTYNWFCRFDSDTDDFSKFGSGLWQLSQIAFTTVLNPFGP